MAFNFFRYCRLFTKHLRYYSIPISFCAPIISRKLDEKTYGDILPDSMVDDVINTVRDTYNNPQVVKQYESIRNEQQSHNDDFMLEEYITTLIENNTNNNNQDLMLLDIGCGSGVTMTKIMKLLSQKTTDTRTIKSCKIVGIDIAPNMLILSDKNLKHCTNEISKDIDFDYELIEGDMRYLSQIMDKNSMNNVKYNGIICNYSIFHVPRQHHQNILNEINKLLKKDGLLFICMGYNDMSLYYASIIFDDKPMFWSHYHYDRNIKIIEDSNFQIIQCKAINDGTSEESLNLFVIARKKNN